MKRILLAATIALGFAGIGSIGSANAQSLTIRDHLTPTPTTPYIRNHVPSQCLGFSIAPGVAPMLYCESAIVRPGDIDIMLVYRGPKPWGWHTPDDCVLRRGMQTGQGYLYCRP